MWRNQNFFIQIVAVSRIRRHHLHVMWSCMTPVLKFSIKLKWCCYISIFVLVLCAFYMQTCTFSPITMPMERITRSFNNEAIGCLISKSSFLSNLDLFWLVWEYCSCALQTYSEVEVVFQKPYNQWINHFFLFVSWYVRLKSHL